MSEPKVFFTYVWGAPSDPAWPLTFSTKAARTLARQTLREGDLVFTVGTRGEPTPENDRGRVLGAYLVSDLEVNTADYQIGNENSAAINRFPYALQPIATWVIKSNNNKFSEVVGPLTNRHHLIAQTTVVELEADPARALLSLDRREVQFALPNTEFGRGRVLKKLRKLAPKHQGMYVASFAHHHTWYVYTLVLKDTRGKVLGVKVGYSSEPKDRLNSYNACIAPELTGVRWTSGFTQPTSSEDAAREIEEAILSQFSRAVLDSNGEILRDVEPEEIERKVSVMMRARIHEESLNLLP